MGTLRPLRKQQRVTEVSRLHPQKIRLTSKTVKSLLVSQFPADFTILVGNCKYCQTMVTLTCGSGTVAGSRMVGTDPPNWLIKLEQSDSPSLEANMAKHMSSVLWYSTSRAGCGGCGELHHGGSASGWTHPDDCDHRSPHQSSRKISDQHHEHRRSFWSWNVTLVYFYRYPDAAWWQHIRSK